MKKERTVISRELKVILPVETNAADLQGNQKNPAESDEL